MNRSLSQGIQSDGQSQLSKFSRFHGNCCCHPKRTCRYLCKRVELVYGKSSEHLAWWLVTRSRYVPKRFVLYQSSCKWCFTESPIISTFHVKMVVFRISTSPRVPELSSNHTKQNLVPQKCVIKFCNLNSWNSCIFLLLKHSVSEKLWLDSSPNERYYQCQTLVRKWLSVPSPCMGVTYLFINTATSTIMT